MPAFWQRVFAGRNDYGQPALIEMPRYFFDVRDGSELARDEVGVDLPDLNAALVEAKTSLADIAREVVRSDGATGHLVIEIRDGAEIVGHAELSLQAAIKPLSI